MWTTENRPRYNRDRLRYPSDLTDEEWARLRPPRLAGGMSGSTCDHSPSVSSLGYRK